MSDDAPIGLTTTVSLTPYLIVRNGAAALDFYASVFGAQVSMRVDQPDGRLGHAEVSVGGATFNVADEFPEMDIVGPATLGGSTVVLDLEVPDVDATVARALAAGATLRREVVDRFFGSRSGQIADPFGHHWTLSTVLEELTEDEIRERAAQMGEEEA